MNLDIYLRAHTEKHVETPRSRKPKDKTLPERWPERALIFDTETRTDVHQQLMFGIYRVCKLVGGTYICESEGALYSAGVVDEKSPTDALTAATVAALDELELNQIGNFVLNTLSDVEVKRFPPRSRLAVHQSYVEFMNKVFWPAVRRGDLCIGFFLPFDLSRIALDWRRTRKGGFSLILAKQLDRNTGEWKSHPYRPEIGIEAKDARTAFITRGKPRFRADEEWTHPGRFLDLSTLLYSLFDKHMRLDDWCAYFQKKGYKIDRKLDHEPSGRVTLDELRYCRQDVKITHQLLNAAMQEFSIHPLPNLLPDKCYSPASIAKAYMKEMGITLPKEKFKTPNEINGIAMQAYYGGRAEVHIRRTKVPVMRVDFVSQYCTVNTLLKNWEILVAESLAFPDCTEEVKRMLNAIPPDKLLDECFIKERWRDFRFYALVKPDHDIFPVRAGYKQRDPNTLNIGLNYLTSEQPIWFAGPDIIASILLNNGKIPHILKAFRVVPSVEKQAGLKQVDLLGKVRIEPDVDDFYKHVVEQKEAHKKDETMKKGLKCVGNAGAYGPLVELNTDLVQLRRFDKRTKQRIALNPKLDVYSGDHYHQQDAPREIEVPGPFYLPPVASLITAGARLLLALAQRCVEDAGGKILFCDTDSLCIVANDKGGTVPAGACNDLAYIETADPREFERIPCLKRETVVEISQRFRSLNPYSFDGTILKVEDVNYEDDDPRKPFCDLYGYAISAKRYCLFEGKTARQIVDAKAHGIGYLMSPVKRDGDTDKFIVEFWQKVLQNEGIIERRISPKWLDQPAMMRIPVSSPAVLGRLKDFVKPYDFVLAPVVRDADLDKQSEKPILITRFTKNSSELADATYYNVRTSKPCRITTGESNDKNVIPVRSYRSVVNTYVMNAESKFNGPDGTQCWAWTRGVLQRIHVVANEHRYCGKEFKRKLEQGPLDHETEFKCKVYENGRVRVPASVKDDIRAIGIREFMRHGIGQHTIEKALNSKIKVSTYTKLLTTIEKITSPPASHAPARAPCAALPALAAQPRAAIPAPLSRIPTNEDRFRSPRTPPAPKNPQPARRRNGARLC